jgi:hypothetical protein
MYRLRSHVAASAGAKIIPKTAAWEHGSRRGTSVPIIVPMVPAVGFNAPIGRFEHLVAPWQAEIAGRDEN